MSVTGVKSMGSNLAYGPAASAGTAGASGAAGCGADKQRQLEAREDWERLQEMVQSGKRGTANISGPHSGKAQLPTAKSFGQGQPLHTAADGPGEMAQSLAGTGRLDNGTVDSGHGQGLETAKLDGPSTQVSRDTTAAIRQLELQAARQEEYHRTQAARDKATLNGVTA